MHALVSLLRVHDDCVHCFGFISSLPVRYGMIGPFMSLIFILITSSIAFYFTASLLA